MQVSLQTIWVDLKNNEGSDEYFIKLVNSGVLDKNLTPTSKAPEIKLECRTDKHVVLVEDISNQKSAIKVGLQVNHYHIMVSILNYFSL